jgi:hypothetical protein
MEQTRIQSKNLNLISEPIALILVIFGSSILVKNLLTNTPFDLFWLFVCILSGWGLIILTTDIYVTYFQSPEWVELSSNNILVKMRFHEHLTIPVSEIREVVKTKFWQITGSYNIGMIIPERNIILYFNKKQFDSFEEFIIALRKVNPNIQVGDSIT